MNGRKEEWIGCEHQALYLMSASYFWSREDGWRGYVGWTFGRTQMEPINSRSWVSAIYGIFPLVS